MTADSFFIVAMSIFGMLAVEGEFVICRLTDLLPYYGRLYEEEKDVISSEREKICWKKFKDAVMELSE